MRRGSREGATGRGGGYRGVDASGLRGSLAGRRMTWRAPLASYLYNDRLTGSTPMHPRVSLAAADCNGGAAWHSAHASLGYGYGDFYQTEHFADLRDRAWMPRAGGQACMHEASGVAVMAV